MKSKLLNGIPVLLRNRNKYIPALIKFGTMKDYPIDLWHREYIITLRYTNGKINRIWNEQTIIIYYTL